MKKGGLFPGSAFSKNQKDVSNLSLYLIAFWFLLTEILLLQQDVDSFINQEMQHNNGDRGLNLNKNQQEPYSDGANVLTKKPAISIKLGDKKTTNKPIFGLGGINKKEPAFMSEEEVVEDDP